MDEFKKYLQEHRKEMDLDTPSANLLPRIQTQTVPKKKGKLYPMLLRITAAACVLALLVFGIKWMFSGRQNKADVVKTAPTPKKPGIVQNSIDTSSSKSIDTTEEDIE